MAGGDILARTVTVGTSSTKRLQRVLAPSTGACYNRRLQVREKQASVIPVKEVCVAFSVRKKSHKQRATFSERAEGL